MGYTIRQIQKHFNDVVDTYKAMLFEEVKCSSTVDYSANGIYRSTILKSSARDSVSVRVNLVSKHDSLDGLDYPAYFIDLDADQYVYDQSKSTAHYNRFYCIDSDYYTLDFNEVKHARDVSLKRYLNFRNNRCKTIHLNINKMSDRLVTYLRKAIDGELSNSTKTYALKDVYFNYTSLDRKLVIIIKREDNDATEAFSFDTRRM